MQLAQRMLGRGGERVPAWSAIIAAVLALFLFAPDALGDHGGPITFVDIKNPPEEDEDCDFHFKTIKAALTKCPLQEHSLIIVDPGTYEEGKLVVDVKGLVLKSSGGAQRTKLIGCFEIRAKEVELRGFDIHAAECDHGITVGEDEVRILENIVHEAKANGIEVLETSDGVILVENRLFNNGGIGIHVRSDSQRVQITDNQVQSNGASGVVLEGNTDRFVISGNEVGLNLGTGILVLGADSGQLTNNTISANQLEGIKLDKSHGNVIVNNVVTANGLFGISLVGSDNNEVRTNQLSGNRAGGVALRGNAVPAQRNTIENNQILRNAQAGASGVLLEGDVTGSIILKNTIVRNSIGIRLTKSEVTEGEPSNNTIDSNEIRSSDMDGLRVEASFSLNLFRSNQIVENNRVGIHILGGQGNDEIASNIIEGNGDDGIRIEGSDRNTIRENEIALNGGSGIVLIQADSTTVRKNLIHDGEEVGLLLSGVKSAQISENTIERYQQDGINGTEVENLSLEENQIRLNRERGIFLGECSVAVDLESNIISANSGGGVELDDCNVADLQSNEISGNIRFGLLATGDKDEIAARRNWWGDLKGPAGVFEGRGNAVLGLEITQVFPWLTDRVGELDEPSVRGFLLQDFEQEMVVLDAMDRADVRLAFFTVEKEERGIAILAKYVRPLPSPNSIHQPGELPNAIKTISVLISGFATGTAVIEVGYMDIELPEGVARQDLHLFYWDGAQWVVLPGRSLEEVNLVEGEIDVALLRDGVIIALAPQL